MEVNTIEIHQKILRRRLLLKIGCTGMFLGLAIGLSIPFMLTAILHLLGFGTKGIIPGSIAAEWQASLHNLTKGTFFACKFKVLFSLVLPHCSKSSFYVQTFNFDFPRKFSIFWGMKNKPVKMLWFLDFFSY